MKRGFTLIEMIVVIGIIAILSSATVAGYSAIVRHAEETRAKELVSNVATALSAMYQREGAWPKSLITAMEQDNMLNEKAGLSIARKGYLTLDMNAAKTSLVGYDRYGIVTPWGVDIIKRGGKTLSGKDEQAVRDHTLRFALDLEGTGFTEVPAKIAGGNGTKVRATVCVWCCDRTGSMDKKKIIKSWTDGQYVR